MYRPGIKQEKKTFTSLFWSEFEDYFSNKVTLSDNFFFAVILTFRLKLNQQM